MDKARKSLVTDAALWRMFRLMDSAYFGNRLRGSVISVEFAPNSFMRGAMGRTRSVWTQTGHTRFRIFINRCYQGHRKVVWATLLHECLHARAWWIQDCSGRVFDLEMRRLCARGAMRGIW